MENKKQTFAILFYIVKSKANDKDEAPIYARITVDGVRSELSINRVIDVNRWDSSAGKVKGNKEDARSINEHIDTIRTKLSDHQNTLIKNNKLVTSVAVKNAYLGITEKKLKLVELFNYHNAQMKEKLEIEFAQGTLDRYTITLKHITDFLEINRKTSDLYLSELNYKFITDFEHYLRTVRKCNNNSAIKYIRNLRKVINIALANDWLDKDPFLKFKGSLKEVERDFLNSEELQAIEDKHFKITRLDEVRDMFVFACYTGLAYADIAKLTLNEIVRGIDGEKWIFTHREKTDTKSNIPLLPKALEIIEKYKKHPECKMTGKLLPVKSNQKMNAYLKEIADLCDINKTLHFHLGRHTAASTVWLTNGVPIETVSSMLGHKKISTTQIYAKVVEKKVSGDMQALKAKLNRNLKKRSKIKTG